MSGRDDPRTGHPNGDPTEMPADLAAVRADDALLDMLGSADCMPGDVDGELARILAEWRREVHTDSVRELVHTDTALAVISAARRPGRRRNSVFSRLAAAAAVMVIAFSTVGLLAKSAHPGDNLWPVAEVLFADYARSVEAAAFVQTELEQAQKALEEGKPEQAQASLKRIHERLPAVAEPEGKVELTDRSEQLKRELVEDLPAPGSPNTGSPDQRPGPGVPSPSNTDSPESSSPPDPSEFFTPDPSQPFTPGPSQSATPDPSPPPSPNPSPPPTPDPSPPPTPDAESLRQLERNRPSSPGPDDPEVSAEGDPGDFGRPPQPPPPPRPPRPPG